MIAVMLGALQEIRDAYLADASMTVAELLIASRAAHAEYRPLADRAAAAKQKKPEGWQQHLWDAYTLRQRAHEADPQHVDAAWSADPAYASHEMLMAFYARQLGLQQSAEV